VPPAHSQYALEWNRARGRAGHLWQDRFFSCPLDVSRVLAALRYVDCNPVRAAVVKREGSPGEGPADRLLTNDWRWRRLRVLKRGRPAKANASAVGQGVRFD
jgi:hypothetical protein